MPRPRSSLPTLPGAFGVRAAISAGASRSALRHPSFVSPHRGVRAFAEAEPAEESPQDRMFRAARRFLPLLRPGEVISHTSALLLHGCPIRVPAELHVSAQPTHERSRARGVYGHRFSRMTSSTLIFDIPAVTATTALFQGAAQLPLRELIVATDHLICPRGADRQVLPPIDEEGLGPLVRRFRGRGARNLKLAVELSSTGAESRMETLTRLLLVAYGLERSFALQSEIHDAAGLIGRFDLVDHERKVLVEYDGDQHRTSKAQYEKDMYRLDRARAAGFNVIQLRRDDVLWRPDITADRIATALDTQLSHHPMRAQLLGWTPSRS